jgi:general secretion pathway protein A
MSCGGYPNVYTEFFNLREEPFRLTPDPKFLQLPEPHRMALEVFLEAILMRKGFLVLCGPIGTGKTMLVHSALHLLEAHASVKGKIKSAFLVNPTLSRDEFLEAILEEFEVPCSATSKPRRLRALHDMLLRTWQQGGTAVLVVDEAHLLKMELLEEIRLLSNADTQQAKLLQIVLSGQPELQVQLSYRSMRAMQQRIAATCQLRALNLMETRMYVTQRLLAAGLEGDSPFSDSLQDEIFDYTEGVPRLINLICDSSLSIGFSRRRRLLDSAVVEEAAGRLNLGSSRVQTTAPISLPLKNTRQAPISAAAEKQIRAAVDLLIHAMDTVLAEHGSNS